MPAYHDKNKNLSGEREDIYGYLQITFKIAKNSKKAPKESKWIYKPLLSRPLLHERLSGSTEVLFLHLTEEYTGSPRLM